MEYWREHYARTLRHWVNRLEVNQAEDIRLNGVALYRTWRLYLAGSAESFDLGLNNVNQTLLAKPDAGHSGLPWSRADWHQPAA